MSRWLRRIAYAFAMLVALTGIAVIWSGFRDNSITGGPLVAGPDGQLLAMLDQLPKVTDHQKSDALRFTAMPWSGFYWFALEISDEGAAGAHGNLIVLQRTVNDHRPVPVFQSRSVRPIAMKHDAYVQLMAEIDSAGRMFAWDSDACRDGTHIAFERWKDGHARSGNGTAGCHKRYSVISAAVARMVSTSGALAVPVDGSWYGPEQPAP